MPEVILIVDDESALRELIAVVLNDAGFPVRTAHNGAEALDHQTREPAALILSDVMMPVVDGHTLVDELRRRGDQTPVVLMSAASPRVARHPGVRFIPKPFNLDDLLNLVRQSLMDDLPAS